MNMRRDSHLLTTYYLPLFTTRTALADPPPFFVPSFGDISVIGLKILYLATAAVKNRFCSVLAATEHFWSIKIGLALQEIRDEG